MSKLKPSELVEVINHHLEYAISSTFFVKGSPAIGKSSMIYLVSQTRADRLKLKLLKDHKGRPINNINPKKNEFGFVDFRCALYESIDFTGIPYIDDEKTGTAVQKKALLDVFPTRGQGIMFLDEVAQCSPALQNTIRQLTFEGRIGTDYVLPKGWKIILAGNHSTDRAGAQRILTHFQSACLTMELIPDVKEWLEWGYANGINADILAFLSFQNQFLHQFDAKKEGGFPAPRTWHQVSEMLEGDLRKSLVQPVLESYLGETVAREFETFRAFQNDLESPTKILKNPKKAKLPERTELQYASVASLINAVETPKDFENALTYVERFKAKEFSVLFVKALTTKESKFKETSVFIDWHIKNQDILV
tara:strand:+ start:636 stop:1727 length:1092 start_codon:yes stop_codon:yes gene_type:complete